MSLFKKKIKPNLQDASQLRQSIETKPLSIPYEITKIKDDKRVVIKRGRVPKTAKWIYWPKMKQMYWNNFSELDFDPVKSKYTLVFDVNFTEPFDETGQLHRSPIVEKALINQSMDDYSEVVALTGFEITTKQIVIMLIVVGLMIPLGLSLNSFFNLVPNINVHWLPSIPNFGRG